LLSDEDIVQDISDAIQSLGGPMTRARARRVNDTIVHFMIKSIEGPAQIEEGKAQVEEKEPKFMIIIKACDSGKIKYKKSGKIKSCTKHMKVEHLAIKEHQFLFFNLHFPCNNSAHYYDN
jgi:hypothetical protein